MFAQIKSNDRRTKLTNQPGQANTQISTVEFVQRGAIHILS
jgi:hypothetical protein